MILSRENENIKLILVCQEIIARIKEINSKKGITCEEKFQLVLKNNEDWYRKLLKITHSTGK